MRYAGRVFAFAAVALSLAAARRPAENARFMFPAVVILRGGGLPAPVVLNHAGAVLGNVSGDTIAILYGSLVRYTPTSEHKVRGRRFIEAAEFIGPEFMSYASGRTPAPSFEAANYFSRIYLPGDGEPLLWESPVVAPGGARRAFYSVGDAGKRVLETRGLKLR